MSEHTEITTYHWVLSYTAPHPRGGFSTGDLDGTFNVAPGMTRQEVYSELRAVVAEQHFNGNPRAFSVTGFSLAPNQM